MTDDTDTEALKRRLHTLETKGILPWEAPLPSMPAGVDGEHGFVAWLKKTNDQKLVEAAKVAASAQERAQEQQRLREQAELAERQAQYDAWRKNRRRRRRELARLQDIEADLEKLRQQEQQLVNDRAACLRIINIGTRPHDEEDG